MQENLTSQQISSIHLMQQSHLYKMDHWGTVMDEEIPISPLVVVAPHAGIYVPPGVSDNLSVPLQNVLMRGDRYTDWVSVGARDEGAAHIVSNIAPGYFNVGRAVTSLRNEDIRGGAGHLTCDPTSPYVNKGQGQGLKPLKTLYELKPMYKEGREPTAQDIQRDIDTYYTPFHDAIDQSIKNRMEILGLSILFDVHSMPSKPTPQDRDFDPCLDTQKQRVDIVLSDAFGESCDPFFMMHAEQTAKQYGYSVSVNTPYSGGYNTRHYGAMGTSFASRGSHALQIEWNRSTLGVDEESLNIVSLNKFLKAQECTSNMITQLHITGLRNLPGSG